MIYVTLADEDAYSKVVHIVADVELGVEQSVACSFVTADSLARATAEQHLEKFGDRLVLFGMLKLMYLFRPLPWQ